MPCYDWSFWFQLLGAIGSLATFGAFLILFKKDKNKQEQLDHLTNISQTWAELYKLEREKFELERSKHQEEKKWNRIALMPELRLTSYTRDKREREIRLTNIGESCTIEEVTASPIGSVSFANTNYPVILDKSKEVSVRFILTNLTHEGDIHIHITYVDKAKNAYQVSVLDGVLAQPVEL